MMRVKVYLKAYNIQWFVSGFLGIDYQIQWCIMIDRQFGYSAVKLSTWLCMLYIRVNIYKVYDGQLCIMLWLYMDSVMVMTGADRVYQLL